jgi:hypothetical protein
MPVQTADAGTGTNVVLDELVKWVKTLGQAGVSPDKAVEVARDFLLAACMADEEDMEEYDDFEGEDDEE